MDPQTNDYHISFFKPTTKAAKLNRDIVLFLFCIWAVAIFGFQIALKVLGKPVPEKAYTEFTNVWEGVRSGSPTDAELKVFAQTCLSVLGKNFIDPEHRTALDNGLSNALMLLAPVEEKEILKQKVRAFEELKAGITTITDPRYVEADRELESMAAPIIGLSGRDVRSTLISAELASSMMDGVSPENMKVIPEAMSLYLIHPQSFLTDGRIFGFPFHYFYSAVFLLVLFVGLCWLYCVRTDRRDAILGIKE